MKTILTLLIMLTTYGICADIKDRYVFNSCEVFDSSGSKKYTGGEYIFTQGFREVVEYRNGRIIRHPTAFVGHGVSFAKFDDCSYLEGLSMIYYCGDDDLYIVYADMSVHYFNQK